MSAFTPPFHGISWVPPGKIFSRVDLVRQISGSATRRTAEGIPNGKRSSIGSNDGAILSWYLCLERSNEWLEIFFSGKKHFHQVEFPVVWRHRIYLRKRAIKLAELKEAQGVAKKVGIFKKPTSLVFFGVFFLYKKKCISLYIIYYVYANLRINCWIQ